MTSLTFECKRPKGTFLIFSSGLHAGVFSIQRFIFARHLVSWKLVTLLRKLVQWEMGPILPRHLVSWKLVTLLRKLGQWKMDPILPKHLVSWKLVTLLRKLVPILPRHLVSLARKLVSGQLCVQCGHRAAHYLRAAGIWAPHPAVDPHTLKDTITSGESTPRLPISALFCALCNIYVLKGP